MSADEPVQFAAFLAGFLLAPVSMVILAIADRISRGGK